MPEAHPSPSDRRSLILGFGFATATAMWALGYVAFMNPGFLLGEVVFGLELFLIIVDCGTIFECLQPPVQRQLRVTKSHHSSW